MRNFGDQIEIDTEAVRTFYDERFDPGRPMASVMLSDDEDLLRRRDENEKQTVLKLFKTHADSTHVLDLGCGNGRWFDSIKESILAYEGVDFSVANINYARKNRKGAQINFESGAAENISTLQLKYSPYDLVLSCGLLCYLNEKQINLTLRSLIPLVNKRAQIYLRTSVSVVGERLTLKDFYSETLKRDYHCIYRTPEEYEAYFVDILLPCGFEITKKGLLLNENLGSKKETNQQYWLLER